MRKTRIVILGAVLGFMLMAKPPLPRPAQEFSFVDSSGQSVSLANYRGKVVLVEFLYTTCPHCQATAQFYTQLQRELGPKGLQILGVAFNPEAEGHAEVVGNFIASNGVEFPVGWAKRDAVLSYLDISLMSRFTVPQVVIIDRNGMIRAQSEVQGSAELQDGNYLRPFLDGLLKERAGPAKKTK